MLQMSFRRYPHNNSWELEHLSVACKWFETLVWSILLSMPTHNFWRVSFLFLRVIFPNVSGENSIHHESKVEGKCSCSMGGFCLFFNCFYLRPIRKSWWGLSLCWFVFELRCLDPGENDRIYNEYGDCVIPFYECIFSILGLWLSSNVFKMEVLKHLMVASSKLHPAS